MRPNRGRQNDADSDEINDHDQSKEHSHESFLLMARGEAARIDSSLPASEPSFCAPLSHAANDGLYSEPVVRSRGVVTCVWGRQSGRPRSDRRRNGRRVRRRN
jgi:hypothetical protein